MNFAICLHAFPAKEMMAWKYDEIETCEAMNFRKYGKIVKELEAALIKIY
jgi:hypothetical protein